MVLPATTSIGERLRLWRTSRGLTQAGLADCLGVDRTTLRKYETDGTAPNAETLAKLCGTGLNINWLLTGEGARLRRARQDTLSEHLRADLRLLEESLRELAALDPPAFAMLTRGFAARSQEAVKLARYETGMSSPAPLIPLIGPADVDKGKL